MPWIPSYTRDAAAAAISEADSWADALRALGLRVHGKTLANLRKWAQRWDIPTEHLPESRPVSHRTRFSEEQLREAIAASRSWSETLRRLHYRSAGGNWKTLKKYAALWEIDTSHFDPRAASIEALRRAAQNNKRPLEEILVENSTFHRGHLKRRLLEEGLLEPYCELCGQGEIWRGERMSLILDHRNGVPNDHRLDNLRLLCPNCAATLSTHCGRKNQRLQVVRECERCGEQFRPKKGRQRYCSRACGSRWDRTGVKRPGGRKVPVRPPYKQLLDEVNQLGYLAVGRKYGVSDNAIRKWIREYARERAIDEGRDPAVVEIPTRTWPNCRDKAGSTA
jgi:hypothetical protein